MALNTLEPVESLTFRVANVDHRVFKAGERTHSAVVITLEEIDELTLANTTYEFVQTEALTEAGVAVQPYGVFILNDLAPTDLDSSRSAKPVILFNGQQVEGNKTIQQMSLGTSVTFGAPESVG